MGSGVDPSMTLHALLGPRDRDNCFLSRFLKQQIIHPGPFPGEGEMHVPSPEAVSTLPGRCSLPTPCSTAPLFEGCCGCGAGAGLDSGGRPRR